MWLHNHPYNTQKSARQYVRRLEVELEGVLPIWIRRAPAFLIKMIIRVKTTALWPKRTKYEVFIFRFKKLGEFVVYNPQ